MRLVVSGPWARLIDAPIAIEEALDEYMTLEYSGFFRTKNMRKPKHKTEYLYLYDANQRRFPAGLLPGALRMLADDLAENRAYYEWAAKYGNGDTLAEAREMLSLLSSSYEDRSEPIHFDPSTLQDKAPWLFTKTSDRDYTFQADAVEAALGEGRGIIKAPTGAGKTNMAAGLFAAVDVPWLFTAPSIDLVTQAKRRYEQLTGEKGGQIGAGKWDPQRVTFATLHTLAKRRAARTPEWLELRREIRGLVVDECHTLPANTFYPGGS